MKTEERKDWQADPEQVESPQGRLTLWSDLGIVLTAQLDVADAKELVRSGRGFVISSGNVGLCSK